MITESRHLIDKLKHNSHLDLNQALFYFVRTLKSYSKSGACSLYLLNRETSGYTLMATKGLKVEAVRKVTLQSNEGLIGHIAAKGESINIEDSSLHPHFIHLPQTGEDQFNSFLGVPITHQREVIGVLVLQRRDNARFSPKAEAFLLTLVAQLSEVIALWDANGDLQSITRQDWRGRRETVLKAIAGSPGAIVGRGLLLEEEEFFNDYTLERSLLSIEDELEVLHQAIYRTREDIEEQDQLLISKISEQERLLFTTYIQLLNDHNMGGEAARLIQKGYTTISAWSHIVNQHCQAFEAMTDSYLKERASDIRDLGRRLLRNLRPKNSDATTYQDGTIIVAREVTPSMLSVVPLDKLAGIVSLTGSNNSHLCILAKALEIPTIVGVDGLKLNKIDKQLMALDGNKGRLYLRPTRQRLAEFRQIRNRHRQAQQQLEKIQDDPTRTSDGHKVKLLVNTGLMADAKNSLRRGAEGVGLYRSEVPFLDRDYMPSEYEQEVFYRQQLTMFAPHNVTMRTLDVGGDKPLAFLPINEANPFLGWRGIRISLDHPDWFLNQVKAMLRASLGLDNLSIMLPMISGITDLDAALMLIKQAFREVSEDEQLAIKQPDIGVMIEVPSAVYLIDEIAEKVDFLSVGSNDLTQYMLAVDRNNSRIAEWYQPYHPAVIKALNYIAKGAKRQDKTLSICGEIAGDPRAIVLLVAMGYHSLSMSSSRLMLAKAVINAIDYEKSKELLKLVLTLPSAEQIEAAVDGFISKLPELAALLELSN